MASPGSRMVAPPPGGPVQPVSCLVSGPDEERCEQALDLVAGERDQSVRGGVAGVFVGADDGKEGVSEHGQGDSARP